MPNPTVERVVHDNWNASTKLRFKEVVDNAKVHSGWCFAAPKMKSAKMIISTINRAYDAMITSQNEAL